jgi:uncharacterized protein DUF1573/peptidase C39-like protein
MRTIRALTSIAVIFILLSGARSGARDAGTAIENNVCGQLTLAAAAEYLGGSRSLDRIFELLPPDGKPQTMDDLRITAHRIGLEASAIRWQAGISPRLPGPAIIRTRTSDRDVVGHFLLLLGLSDDLALVLDLPDAPQWIPMREIWRTWDGVALHIALSKSQIPRPEAGAENLAVPAVGILLGSCALLLLYNTPLCRRLRSMCRTSIGHRVAVGIAAFSAPLVAFWFLVTTDGFLKDSLAPASRPSLEVNPPSLNIVLDAAKGSSSVSDVNAIFQISNRGTLPARIKAYKSSCGCALPTVSSNNIPAGGTVWISVGVRPDIGKAQSFSIWVYLDKPKQQTLELRGSVSVRDPPRR